MVGWTRPPPGYTPPCGGAETPLPCGRQDAAGGVHTETPGLAQPWQTALSSEPAGRTALCYLSANTAARQACREETPGRGTGGAALTGSVPRAA